LDGGYLLLDSVPAPPPPPTGTGWGELAEDLLAAAMTSGVQVKRAYVAPGPVFSRDCRSIVVYMSSFGVRPLQRGDFTGTCAIVPQITLTVVFVADCVPAIKDGGVLPSAAEIDAWSTQFLDDTGEIFTAVLEWAPDGDCSRITVGDGLPGLSPDGQVAELRWTVTLSLVG
jgi:hypothetical protein